MKKNLSPESNPHLGGHCFVTHIDEGLLIFCKDQLNCKNMIDIGCGPGGMIELANKMGIDAIGVDGDPRLTREDDRIIIHDYAAGILNFQRTFDLAYSCEFVEHVEEKYIPNFIETFKLAHNVILTYAPENTPGHHHVNCKSEEYWIQIFESYNFLFDRKITNKLRLSSTMKRDFVRLTGLYFKNNDVRNHTPAY
jgi:SAM-dependent methyltransferase